MVMRNGKIASLQLGRGMGKNPLNAQYVELLPVNVLMIPPKIINTASVLRAFPGTENIADVDGVSRGALLNPADAAVMRVCGKQLYRNHEPMAEIEGDDRVSMAGSIKSVAVSSLGKMHVFKGDGSRSVLENWPESEYFPGEQIPLGKGSAAFGYDGTLDITESMALKGKIILTLTPATTTGAVGEPLELDLALEPFSQEPAPPGTPYITDAIVNGFYISGTTVTVSYTFNANGADGEDDTQYLWMQIVSPTTVKNAQFDLGYVSDIVHAGARYAWVKKGTNTFGVTDISAEANEAKPDRYRPFTTAESFPDPAVGIGELNDDIVLFGTVSTEFFTLSGESDPSQPIYRSQPGAMIAVGIAGPHCKALAGKEFAVISHPAGGRVSVYLLGSGRATDIASPAVIDALAKATPDELAAGVVEYLETGIHRLIIVRFGHHVFCHDKTSKAWFQLCSDNVNTPHKAIDFIARGGVITAGNTHHGTVSQLSEQSTDQDGKPQPHQFYTSTLSLLNSKLFDLELSVATGLAKHPQHIFASASTDGVVFPVETQMHFDAPHHHNIKPKLARVGFVRDEIVFRFRIVSAAPFSVSACQVRVV